MEVRGLLSLMGELFDFQPETGKFTYTPRTELIDGIYPFKLEVQDTAGNSAAPIDFTFTIDTRPFQASISAERVEGSKSYTQDHANYNKTIGGNSRP